MSLSCIVDFNQLFATGWFPSVPTRPLACFEDGKKT